MFKGTVKFRAKIKGNGRTFHLLEFNPNKPGVDKVEMQSPAGDEILGAVHLASVATPEDGETIATKVHTAALNRLCFFHGIAIEAGHITDSNFSPVNPSPGIIAPFAGETVIVGEQPKLVTSLSAADLKADLERASPPEEKNFGLFRSARQSVSPVEEFMNLYQILLMLFLRTARLMSMPLSFAKNLLSRRHWTPVRDTRIWKRSTRGYETNSLTSGQV